VSIRMSPGDWKFFNISLRICENNWGLLHSDGRRLENQADIGCDI